MQKIQSFVKRLAQRLAVCLLICGANATVTAAPHDHAPSSPLVAPTAADAVNRFLIEKGLVSAALGENGLVSQVRDKATDMVLTAMNFLGVRYQRGGTDADVGFDCSGFTRQVFEMSLGLVLPRRADEQAKASGLVKVSQEELQPGDLVFFNTLRRTFSHVGIYIGEGKFVHSPKPGGEVRVEDMRIVYWAKRFTGARRAEPIAEQADASTSAGAQATASMSAPVSVQTLSPSRSLR